MTDATSARREAVTFYDVEVVAPGVGSSRTLCPGCLRAFAAAGRRPLVVASLPPNEDEPRTCADCARPQLGCWTQLERWAAEWDMGTRLALAEDAPF